MKLWLDQMLPRRLCDPIAAWTGCDVWHVGTLRCGNCSNPELERILKATLPTTLELLEKGEPIVEITGAARPIKPTE